MRMACVGLFVCWMALSVASVSAQSLRREPGPTSPEVRREKLKANHVGLPTGEQVRRIEAAAPEKAPATPARPRKVLVWGHVWTHGPNPYAEKALEVLGKRTGAFTAVVSDDPGLLLANRLSD